MTDHTPPDGFVRIPLDTGFIGTNGPLYLRREGEDLLVGCRIEERHCNPLGLCHGGWLATFADMQLPFASRAQSGLANRFLLTMSLTTDYLAPVRVGAWLQGRTEVLRVTRTTIFSQMTATADGALCLRANGIFRIGPEVPVGDDPFTRLLKGE